MAEIMKIIIQKKCHATDAAIDGRHLNDVIAYLLCVTYDAVTGVLTPYVPCSVIAD